MCSVTSESIPTSSRQLLITLHGWKDTPTLAWYSFSLAIPVSTTYLTPGIVTLVSATFVARITFRVFGGVTTKALACSCGESLA